MKKLSLSKENPKRLKELRCLSLLPGKRGESLGLVNNQFFP